MASVALDAMRAGLRNSAAALENYIEAYAALGPKVGDQVVAEHLDLTLRRLRALHQELHKRASLPAADADALFVAIGQAAAGLASLAKGFHDMHTRLRVLLPNRLPPEGQFDEEEPLEEPAP